MNPPPADQLPPHSIPDEAGVLACVLQDCDYCLPELSQVTEKYFYDVFHQMVWKAMQKLIAKNEPVNEISVSRNLSEQNLENAFPKTVELAGMSPGPSNLKYYLPTFFEKFTKRRIAKGAGILQEQAMNGATVAEVMATADKLLAIQPITAAPIHDGQQASRLLLDDLERRFNLKGELPGLDTGLHGLNSKLDGLQFGEQTLIAARPSVGKTAIGLGIFAHCVFTLQIPALFVSLEMSTPALMRRLLSTRSEITMGELRHGTYSEGSFQKFTSFAATAKSAPIHILDGAAGMSITEIIAAVRLRVKRNAVRLVVVDYLQKITATGKHEKRTYEVAEVSGRLRALAVETGAAFLTLAQLNRESEKDKKPRMPRLSDLADSSQIERDADSVILLHRNRDEANGEALLIVAKQRDGETGCVKVHFNGPLCRFENPSRIDPADYPPPYSDT